jgi:hypothetical protein
LSFGSRSVSACGMMAFLAGGLCASLIWRRPASQPSHPTSFASRFGAVRR